ncbi:MFS transporter [Saccharopolyspora sp. WRP15-2]|uniref:MFS transporter n=1 Tax=Saccharopolyspora oryzae TaxID=2997343 RepID=A0ABT4V6B0_9PSEU|nr:MFS transporter [Saccharopolyspora oryzae]MDA3629487.1 MFS transporter [Saccharopolyspora oryzae]
MTAGNLDHAVAAPAAPPVFRPAMAWTITAMLVLFMIVNWADKAVLGIVAQPLKADLGLSSAEIGFIGSAFFFLYSISGVAVGFLANKVKTKWVLLGLAVLWSLTQVPVLLSATGAALLMSRIALGAAEGPATAMANAGTFEWFPKEKRSLPSAWLSSGASIAKIAVAPVLTLIVVAWGWRAAFVTLALVGVVWCVAWLLIGREGPYATPRGKTAEQQSDTGIRVPFRKIALSRSFIGGAIGTFMVYGMVSVVLTWLPSYFEVGLGFSRVQAGSMFGLPSITGMIGMVGAGWLTDRMVSRGSSARVQRGLVPAVSLLIGGGLLAALPYIGGAWAAVAVVVVAYGFMVVSLPVMNAVVSQISPTRQQPGALGFFLALQTLSGLFAPALTGALVDVAPTPGAGYAQAFQLFGVAVLVGGVVMALLVDPDRDARRIFGGVRS